MHAQPHHRPGHFHQQCEHLSYACVVANACVTEVDFHGYEGCELVDLTDLLAPIAYASGFIQIIMGLFLLFLGR